MPLSRPSLFLGLALLLVGILAGCGACSSGASDSEEDPDDTEASGSDTSSPSDVTPGDTASGVSCEDDPFSDAFMRRAIETLAQPGWEGRRFDSAGHTRAAAWIRDQFACVGLVPGAPSLAGLPHADFMQPFVTDGDEMDPGEILDYTFDPGATYPFSNVIGSLPGKGALANEVVVIGAHLDHLGRYGALDGALVLGANDDASGVLALLAIARQLASEAAPASRRTLIFAAWAVEEDPFYLRGSRAFLSAVDSAARARIMSYVNFDMIGSYRDGGGLYLLGAFEKPEGTQLSESAAHRIGRELAPSYPTLDVRLGERGQSSDHVTFCEAGIPYVFFWTEDDCYHLACDTPSRIDYANLGPILRLATDLTRRLAIDPGLAVARSEFTAAYRAAFSGTSCAWQE